MKRLAYLLSWGTLLGISTALQAQERYCLINRDTAGTLVASLQRIISESDSVSLANVGLSKVAANRVRLVTDNEICRKAVAGYRAATGHSSSPTAAYVIRVGTTRLVVVYPPYGAGEFRSHIVLDASNYSYVAWMEG